MWSLKKDFFQAGTIEIVKYVPLKLIGKDINEMDVEEFIEALAKSRFIQELEENITARAISKVFGEGE